MAEHTNLRKKAVLGALWSIGTSFGSRILGVIGTLALTYVLVPEVVGEVTNASILVLTANMLATLGLGQYIVSRIEAGRAITFQITVVYTLLGVVALGIVTLFPGLFSDTLNSPNLSKYIPGLALAMFIERIGYVPERLLTRKLDFRAASIARTGGELVYTGLSVGLAYAGFGGMAIVWANILRAIVRTGFIAVRVPLADWLTPHPIRLAELKPVFVFSIPVAITAFCAFASMRFDNLLMSTMFGVGIAGLYNAAYNLADLPADQIGEQIAEVLLPSFARVPPEQRTSALIRSIGILSLIITPMSIGLGACADTASRALLGDSWEGVGPMLLILAVLSVVRPLGWVVNSYQLACNRPRVAMVLGVAKVVILLGMLYTLGRFGPLWACAAVGLAFALHAAAGMWTVTHYDGASFMAFVRRFAPPIVPCIPMVIAVRLLRSGLLRAGWEEGRLMLVLEVIVGAAVFVPSAFALAPGLSREMLALLREALVKRRSGDRSSDVELALQQAEASEASRKTLKEEL